jgi:hypothetical protein
LNLQFIGDSYDIIKRSFISWLSDFGRWSVHPMFTDEVDPDTAETFAKFLNATLVSRDRLRPDTDRAAYFECCLSAGNLFLDPDTGVSLDVRTGARSSKYIFAPELLRVVVARPHRLTLVFDQSFTRARRQEMEDNVRRKLAALAAGGAYGFAYVSHAPFLCLAADPSIVLRAFEALKANSALPPARLIA